MTDLHDPDVRRFLELLVHKIGINVLARVTIVEHTNPLLKLVRYYRAEAGLETDASAQHRRMSEMTVSAKLIDSVFQLALRHEDSVIPFMDGKLVFYDVVAFNHERRQSLVIVFVCVNAL